EGRALRGPPSRCCALSRCSQGWCREGDLNPHGFPHTPLKRTCLPDFTIPAVEPMGSCRGAAKRRWRHRPPEVAGAGLPGCCDGAAPCVGAAAGAGAAAPGEVGAVWPELAPRALASCWIRLRGWRTEPRDMNASSSDV